MAVGQEYPVSCKEAPGQQGLVPKLPDLTCFALGAAGLVSDASVTSGVYGKAGAKIIVGGLRMGVSWEVDWG